LRAARPRIDQVPGDGQLTAFRAPAAVGQRFSRFERPGARFVTIRYLLPRLRLVTTARRFVALLLSMRFSRLQLIDRISSSSTSQSSICVASTACVEPRAVNTWKRDFAARIFFNEFNTA
jgi:hypothetical protein